jgi:hypothetical protein
MTCERCNDTGWLVDKNGCDGEMCNCQCCSCANGIELMKTTRRFEIGLCIAIALVFLILALYKNL